MPTCSNVNEEDNCRPVATALWAVSVAGTVTQNQNGPQGRGYNL